MAAILFQPQCVEGGTQGCDLTAFNVSSDDEAVTMTVFPFELFKTCGN